LVRSPVHRCNAEVFTYAGEHAPCSLDVFRINPAKRLGSHLVRYRAQLLDEGLRICGDVKPPCPAVGRIGCPLDEPGLLEPVDDPRQGDRLDVEHVGQLDLSQPRQAGQLEQHLPLRARDTEPHRSPVERLAQGVCSLAHLEWNSFHLQLDIVSVLILSNG